MAPRGKRKASTSTAPPKRRKDGSTKSVWNTPDDWDQLVADSTLSTGSVSRRRPPHAGLKPLTWYAAETAARNFKALWEIQSGGITVGDFWKGEWTYVQDPIKDIVRNKVFDYWGSFLSAMMIAGVFSFPPIIYLPGGRLPAVSEAKLLKPLRPPSDLENYTTLVLTKATNAESRAIAGLIGVLPRLQVLNIKGCKNADSLVIETMIKACPDIKKVNLKGTNVNEEDLQLILARYGRQLLCLKVDKLKFTSDGLEGVFAAESYPNITHLSLPGDFLNSPSGLSSGAQRYYTSTVSWPTPRDTPATSKFTWHIVRDIFPSLTHLYLPGLLIPPRDRIILAPHRLIKLSLGPGGPPVPLGIINYILETQCDSLEVLDLGHFFSDQPNPRRDWDEFEFHLSSCSKLRDLKINVDPIGSKNLACDRQMGRELWGALEMALMPRWNTLKRVSLRLPGIMDHRFLGRPPATFTDGQLQRLPPSLEILELPSVSFRDHDEVAVAIAQMHNLQLLDVSGTSLEDEDLYLILDHCRLVHTIDLTSCRGVKIPNRRNIFKAWEAARKGS